MAIQNLCHYHYERFLVGEWRLFDMGLQIGAPLFLALAIFKMSLSNLYLGRPHFTRATTLWSAVVLVASPILIYIFSQHEGIQNYYFGRPTSERISFFAVFTLSTIPGWEFLHRGFFLGAFIVLLKKEVQIPKMVAEKLALLIILSFEVLYHHSKPELEAWGLLLLSPILTWITYQSRSLWPALILHLWVELWFFLSLQ